MINLPQNINIVHSSSLNGYYLAAVLAARLLNYNLVIVTDHATEFTEVLMKINYNVSHLVKCWKYKELVIFPIINYTDDIDFYLFNEEVDIILFVENLPESLSRKLVSIDGKVSLLDKYYPDIIVLSTLPVGKNFKIIDFEKVIENF